MKITITLDVTGESLAEMIADVLLSTARLCPAVVNAQYEITRQVPEDLKAEGWGYLNTQAYGMDTGSLCEYYADNEIEKYDEDGIRGMIGGAKE